MDYTGVYEDDITHTLLVLIPSDKVGELVQGVRVFVWGFGKVYFVFQLDDCLYHEDNKYSSWWTPMYLGFTRFIAKDT